MMVKYIISLLVGMMAMMGLAQNAAMELPMPEIPAEITERAARISYVTDHVWDSLDFSDTSRSADPDFMGLNFANFALFLSYQPDSVGVARSAKIFLDKASSSDAAFATARKVARQYLSYQDSPVHNDEIWLVFLDILSQMPNLSEQDKARYDDELEMARKNRIGTVASDFEFENRGDGANRTLLSTPGGSRGLILMFYNPDCEHCLETIDIMRNSELINNLIKRNEITVVAIDAEEDHDYWKQTNATLPAEWIVGFNTDGIIDNDLYAIPSLPTLYLLDSEHRVVAKELTDLEQLIKILK